MRRKAAPSTTLLAALLLAGTALTASAVTFNLSDGATSISCPASIDLCRMLRERRKEAEEDISWY